MKILHIYNNYYPPTFGGIEKHLNTLCEGLKDRFQIEVLTAGKNFVPVTEIINGVRVTRAGSLLAVQSAPISPAMPHFLKKSDAEILHFQLPCPTAMASYFIARAKGRVIATYQSDIVRQKWAMPLYAPLLNKFLERCDRIIVTSPNYIEISPFLQRFKEKCVVIPIGIDISNFHYAEPKKPNVLFVGRLRYYKGLEYLIQAMTEVNAELNIVGTGSEEQKLKALTAKLNLSAKIHFLGDIAENELPKYYANCSVFTLPSIFKTEAFGISQLEAMASAKPIVSTSLGTGVDWINQNGTTGFTVPPKKARALSDALNTILSDNTLRQRLGKAARNRTEQYFSKEIMLEKISAIYQQTAF